MKLSDKAALSIFLLVLSGPCSSGRLSTEEIAASPTCLQEERVVFTCTFKSGKLVSICKSSRRGESILTYRYGSPRAVEFTYTDLDRKDSGFYYKIFDNHRSTFFELGFSNEGFKYSITRDWAEDAPEPTYQLRVHGLGSAARKSLELTCYKDIVDKGLTGETNISCDPDADPGCNYEDNKAAGRAM